MVFGQHKANRDRGRIGQAGRRSEERVAKTLGARLRPNSGAVEGIKGDMTVEDLAEGDVCVNCHTPEDEWGRHVEGWGYMCDMCYEGMMDVRMEEAQAYADPHGW